MEEKMKTGYYNKHQKVFIVDMKRIFKNCRSYNDVTTEYSKCADKLEKYFYQQLAEFGLEDKPYYGIAAMLQ